MPFGNRESVPGSSAPRHDRKRSLRSKHVRYAFYRDRMTVNQAN
jgi:hypothetical protein